ncbi:MAG: putative CDP-diacylglycerol inositol 3-phosphatidyltransferase [Candidatus Aminicenantes bacterium]|nr:putative CDP-diacylglycerol inositol 3-phosphatidyltransferase [Candidatus Aminicenantes bacterium]
MFNGGLRKTSNLVFDRIGFVVAKTRIPPNVFSSLALVVAAAGSLFFYFRRFVPAFVFIGLACLWDTFDGAVARAEKRVTKFGYYLEGIIDKWVEIIIYAGFALSGYALESFLVIAATLMESFAKPRAAQVVPMAEFDWPAIGERLDRLLLLNIGLAVFLFVPGFRIGGREVRTLTVVFAVLFVMVLIGGVQRILFARKIIALGGTDQLHIAARDVFSNGQP